MHLSLLHADDERLGLPSGSTFERLTKCPASHVLSQKAEALGQVAHESAPDSERGTLIHKAYELQSSEGLSDTEAADFEAIMAQREAITAEWLPSGAPLKRIAEERLWLHRSFLRPVMSGQIDELLIQGSRALLFDVKSGRGQVDEPQANIQLRIYAMLVKVRWPELESVTVAVLSPHYRYAPHTFRGAELDTIRDETLATLAALDYEAAPSPGNHCCFCPASMICPSRRQETGALTAIAEELPSGADAARLLEMVTRVEAVCEEIRAHYKGQLEAEPLSIPGWKLISSTRRWIPRPQEALEQLIEIFSITEFLDSCTVKVADLEAAYARKNNLPAARAKAAFSRIMGSAIGTKRTAPSLKQVNS
jgi:uncharacterized protein DUF2800